MAAKLFAVILLTFVTQGFALPTSDVTIQDGDHLSWGVSNGISRCISFASGIMSGTSTQEITGKGLFGCLPNLMLVFDAVSDVFKLYAEWQKVRDGLNAKREKCDNIADRGKREKCYRNVEAEEKTEYQKITDKFRSLLKDVVTEFTGFFKCLIGL